MGREDGAGAHDLECLVEAEAAADQVADALEPQESGVALVRVEHLGRRRAGELDVRLDRADPADAQQQFLQQPVLAAAAVESVGHGAQRVVVFGDIRVEQKERDAADRDLPDASEERGAVRAGPA